MLNTPSPNHRACGARCGLCFVWQVNYTRKIQHFAAYMIPVVIKPPADCTACTGLLADMWSSWVTLLAFLILIKPIRENCVPVMLQVLVLLTVLQV